MFNNCPWYPVFISAIFAILLTVAAPTSVPTAKVYAQNGGNMTQPEIGQTVTW